MADFLVLKKKIPGCVGGMLVYQRSFSRFEVVRERVEKVTGRNIFGTRVSLTCHPS